MGMNCINYHSNSLEGSDNNLSMGHYVVNHLSFIPKYFLLYLEL